VNPAILFLSTALMTSGAPIGCDGAGCGSAAALPTACSGCGPSCASGVCGKGDPNPLEKTGLFATIKKRLTPGPRKSSTGCDGCGAPSRGLGLGLFQGGLLGRLNSGHAAPAVAGCSEPSIVIGNTPVSPCAIPAAPIMSPVTIPPQTMPISPVPQGETRPVTPMPMPMPNPAPDKKPDLPKGGSVSIPSLPSIPSVPVSPASGPAASTSKPRF
jgi:hypothetical protein